MVTFVLDSSSILRYFDKEAGALRVAEILKECFAGKSRLVVSSVQWGELACVIHKRQGRRSMEVALAGLLSTGIEVIPATEERAVHSGIMRATRKIPYADCFAVELASDSSDHVLITADFDFKAAENDVRIEFLPANTRSS